MIKSDRANLLKEFIKNYKFFYPGLMDKNIKECFYGYSSEINQIYCHLGLIDLKDTDYFEFYKILKEHFDLKNKIILDVASGVIPVLASIIKDTEKIKVTAVNDKILFKNYHGVITKEADLNNYYDLSEFDLIIGFRPCVTTDNMMQLAIKNKKDFCFYMCPCTLKPRDVKIDAPWGQRKWYDYLKSLIQNDNNYELKVTTSKNLLDDCPIFIGKYKKL